MALRIVLIALAVHRAIIAPDSIARRNGNRIETDWRNARVPWAIRFRGSRNLLQASTSHRRPQACQSGRAFSPIRLPVELMTSLTGGHW
ncbi:MAG: hypothetical protein OXI44_12820 [Bacteroidota bacterium]|nr:hypothetical protein [Bacteroidota bacterium]